MIGKIIAVVAIVLAGVAALVIVARPELDPDLIVGYWQRVDDGTGAAGPDLVRIDRDGTDYVLLGVLSPTGEYTGLNEESMQTAAVDDQGVSLKAVTRGALAGDTAIVKVRIQPSPDGKSLNVAVIPWEEDDSGVPTNAWLFTKASGSDADLEEQLKQQTTLPSTPPAPAP